jgi:hypothetical protein
MGGACGAPLVVWPSPACMHAFPAPGTCTWVQVLKAGSGPPFSAGDSITAHYTGVLLDAARTKFDSSRDRGQPVDFPLGLGRCVVEGLRDPDPEHVNVRKRGGGGGGLGRTAHYCAVECPLVGG